MVTLTGPNIAKVTVNLQEVHQSMVGLMEMFEENGTTMGVAATALAMAMGRLMGPDMSEEEEIAFITAIMEWAGTYFAGENN